MALLVGLAVLFGIMWTAEGQAVHSLAGKRLSEITGRPVPSDVDRFVHIDAAFICLLTIALGVALRYPRTPPITAMFDRRHGDRQRLSGEQRWKIIGGVAVAVYVFADVVETGSLQQVAQDPGTGKLAPSGQLVLRMARASDLKWIALAVAVIAVVAHWGRRTPVPPAGTESWHRSDHQPNHPPESDHSDSWQPSAHRFGISISGGGIRSASFALGVMSILNEHGVLARARYVTCVSGGAYAASALEHANRMGESEAQMVARLRGRLNYLLPNTRTSLAAMARVLFGLLVNLCILYLVIFMVARPIGWTVGSPLVQEGLRYEGDVVVGVVSADDDPDRAAGSMPRWAQANECGLGSSPASRPTINGATERRTTGTFDGSTVVVVEFDLVAPRQCLIVEREDVEAELWTIDVVPPPVETDPSDDGSPAIDPGSDGTGLIRIENGVAEILRQPTMVAARPKPAGNSTSTLVPPKVEDLVDVVVPDLKLTERAQGVVGRIAIDKLIEPIDPLQVEPVSIVDLRGGLDWDRRHALVPGIAALAMVLVAALGASDWTLSRVDRRRRAHRLSRIAAWSFGALFALFVVLPWLVDVVPSALTTAATTGPTSEQTSSLPWLPTGFPPLLAWPALAVGTVIRFVQQQRSKKMGVKAADRSKKRNAAVFVGKIVTFVTRLSVGLVLVSLLVATSITMLTASAINGPFGDYAWISRDFFGLPIPGPPDLAVWLGVIVVLLVARSLFSAGSWSLGPYYRRQLRWAFMGDQPGHEEFDGSDFTPSASAPAGGSSEGARAGYLSGTTAELVVCAAANIFGADRAPAGRRAVSFSVSRSWIGGPELGWMPTPDYLARLGRGRRADVTVPAMTALSGSAVSPAMGKGTLGPIGSVLAVLNVRLGGWLPHPQAVDRIAADGGDEMTPDAWKHTPGWPYFVREVIRRHKHEAAYVYVSDGGHWENLGLVEQLRRGSNTIVMISAAGDGGSSHATLAEAIEIARTDMHVDIEFDDVWKMRPLAGGDPASVLGSGRQFLRQRGDDPEIGRVSPFGWAVGTFTRQGVEAPHDRGVILLIEASMVDQLPADVHAYAEGHAEFPDASTGDQFFTNRDFESYRLLGRTLAEQALAVATIQGPTPRLFMNHLLDLPSPGGGTPPG